MRGGVWDFMNWEGEGEANAVGEAEVAKWEGEAGNWAGMADVTSWEEGGGEVRGMRKDDGLVKEN